MGIGPTLPTEKLGIVSCAALTKLVFQKPPPGPTTFRAAPCVNPVPLMVKFVGIPAGTVAGLTEVMFGTTVGWVMTNDIGVEGPPPGAGLLTVTGTVPG